jgi:hypothetical protein
VVCLGDQNRIIVLYYGASACLFIYFRYSEMRLDIIYTHIFHFDWSYIKKIVILGRAAEDTSDEQHRHFLNKD